MGVSLRATIMRHNASLEVVSNSRHRAHRPAKSFHGSRANNSWGNAAASVLASFGSSGCSMTGGKNRPGTVSQFEFIVSRNEKARLQMEAGFIGIAGTDLLSHQGTWQYHRRWRA